MPDDPNKKMDDLLKAYARERRKAPELNLHPATRKMLQGEVARTIGSTHDRPSWLHRLRAFWPQIAFAGSLCVIFGIAVLSLRQRPGTETESVREQSPMIGKETVLNPAPPESAGTDADAKADLQLGTPLLKQVAESELRESEGLKDQKKEKALANQPALYDLARERVRLEEQRPAAPRPESDHAPVVAQTPAQTRTLSAAEEQVKLKNHDEAKRSDDLSFYSRAERPALALTEPTLAPTAASDSRGVGSVAPRPPADPSAAGLAAASTVPSVELLTAEKLARANEMTNLGAARRIQFFQSPATAPAAAAMPMFTSFQMEQLGTNVRFLDQDGSVYFGVIESPTNLGTALAIAPVAQRTAPRPVLERLEDSLRGGSEPATNLAAFNFTAVGTNRTLGRNVRLTGQYFENTNAAATTVETFASSPRGQAGGRAAQQRREDAQHVIIGTAVVGNTNQIPVRAVSRE